MKRTRTLGLFRLFRVELPAAAGLCAVLGQLLAAGTLPSLSLGALAFFAIFCLSATALILNDYFDYEIDLVNAPGRPLPSGMVTKREALVLAAVVALAGFIASALISLAALLVAVAVWAVGVAYNARYKRSGLPGNLMVSVSVGMTFVFGGISVGHPGDVLVWWFGLLAALFDLGEEIAADAMDAEGDRLIGSRSLAILVGPRRALGISAGVFGLVVVVSLLPFVFGWLEAVYLFPLLLMDAVIVFCTAGLLSARTAQPRRLIRWNYIGASISLLLILVMRLALP